MEDVRIDCAAPEYAGAPYPEFDPLAINESRFERDCRFKEFNAGITGGKAKLLWKSQEAERPTPAFDEEIRRAFLANGAEGVVDVTWKSRHSSLELRYAIELGRGQANFRNAKPYNKNMKTKTKENVMRLARATVKLVSDLVRSGCFRPEYPGEKPTSDRIRKSVRRLTGVIPGLRNVFKTRGQYELYDAYVYQRLRRDGVLKLMRPVRNAV